MRIQATFRSRVARRQSLLAQQSIHAVERLQAHYRGAHGREVAHRAALRSTQIGAAMLVQARHRGRIAREEYVLRPAFPNLVSLAERAIAKL